jgi:dynein intermediate chain 4, axonemal
LFKSESENKHLSPVWNLRWIDKEKNSTNGEEEMQVLMSVASDGRVTQWMIRKGFESSDYLKLKRVTQKKSNNNNNMTSSEKKDKSKSDGFISRYSGGLCFDVWENDKSM